MILLYYIIHGAIGGAIVSLITFFGDLTDWSRARHEWRHSPWSAAPRFRAYVDPTADLLVLLTRIIIGAVACGILHDDVKGTVATITVGASGPAVLAQLRKNRSVPEREITEQHGYTGVNA